MKKNQAVKLCIKLILVVCTFVFSGCVKNSAKTENSKIKIVATIFPEYDWLMNVIGSKYENFEVTLLLDKGTDLHNYQPSASDIMKLAKADMFVYVGGESDEWVCDALKEAVNKNMVVLNLMELLESSVKAEEVVEGMEAENEDDDDGDEIEYDEHVWLSLRNAQIVCSAFANELAVLDKANAAFYKENAAAYNAKLAALDKEFLKEVDSAGQKVFLFADRFPFRYFADDYGIKYYAAFAGCSAETEASFATVKFLADKTEQLGLSCVCTIEKSDKKVANAVISNTRSKNQQIVEFDSMQSTTASDVLSGATYIGIMQKNLEALKAALK